MLVITTRNESERATGDSPREEEEWGECEKGVGSLRDDETIMHAVAVKCTPGRLSLGFCGTSGFAGLTLPPSPFRFC